MGLESLGSFFFHLCIPNTWTMINITEAPQILTQEKGAAEQNNFCPNMRHTQCSRESSGRDFQIVGCFLKQNLWSWSLHVLTSREALHLLLVTSDPHDSQKAFCKTNASLYWTPPSPKPYILTFHNCHFGAVTELSEMLPPGLQTSFCPK